jgi:hypothetical protein
LLVRRAAAEGEETGAWKVGLGDDHPRAERECAETSSRLGGDDAANLE